MGGGRWGAISDASSRSRSGTTKRYFSPSASSALFEGPGAACAVRVVGAELGGDRGPNLTEAGGEGPGSESKAGGNG